jgi:hypothetical protein
MYSVGLRDLEISDNLYGNFYEFRQYEVDVNASVKM